MRVSHAVLAGVLLVSNQLASAALPALQYIDGRPACPSDLDIRNLETRLSAVVHRASNEARVRQELQKATTCRQVGARYSEVDWKVLQAVLRGEE